MFTRVEVSTLSGAALDWAVGTVSGMKLAIGLNHTQTGPAVYDAVLVDMQIDNIEPFAPSVFWREGGPLIESERITINQGQDIMASQAVIVDGELKHYAHKCRGRHPLEAAMRCYVTGKVGNSIEVPTELVSS